MTADIIKGNSSANTLCEICGRLTPDEHQELHHLIPRKSRKGKKIDQTILVCNSCGDQLHQLFTNKELAKTYNTIEKILTSSKVILWINWIRKKPNDFSICMAKKKRK